MRSKRLMTSSTHREAKLPKEPWLATTALPLALLALLWLASVVDLLTTVLTLLITALIGLASLRLAGY